MKWSLKACIITDLILRTLEVCNEKVNAFLKIFMYKYECNIVNYRQLLSSLNQVTNTWILYKLQKSLKFQMATLSCNYNIFPIIWNILYQSVSWWNNNKSEGLLLW